MTRQMSVSFGIITTSTTRKEKMIDRTNWAKFPFSVDGVDFNSEIDQNGNMYKTISKLPEGIFSQMNIGATRSMVGNASLFSRSELQDELDRVNEGYHEAYISLA